MDVNEEYDKLEKIGEGSFGTVWKCTFKKNKQVFALKVVELSLNPVLLASLMSEIIVLKEIAKHERLINFYGCKVDELSLCIFTELMSQGSLRDVMAKKGVFTEAKAAKYTKETLEGLNYLHENNVIHRDIKCGNILLNEHDHIKLTDFGLSKLVENKSVVNNETLCGTLHFMAPEILEKSGYSSSIDIWALGVTVVEMLTGMPLFFNLPPILFVIAILALDAADLPVPNLSKDLKYFFMLTFVKKASDRPKARDLFRCKFILSAER